MSTEPRAALARLVGALEAHLDAVQGRRSDTDPVVKNAYQTLADAFEAYDEVLYDEFDEVTPFILFDDEDDDLEDDDEDVEDDDLDEDDEDDDEDGEPEDDAPAGPDDTRPRL